MVARGILSFGTLGGATDPKIRLCQKYFCQFSADIGFGPFPANCGFLLQKIFG